MVRIYCIAASLDFVAVALLILVAEVALIKDMRHGFRQCFQLCEGRAQALKGVGKAFSCFLGCLFLQGLLLYFSYLTYTIPASALTF